VLFVNYHFRGEKSGKRTGNLSNIVVNDAGNTKPYKQYAPNIIENQDAYS